ncbi:MAG: enoyl-CoA hydratase/isomerase family protein, partial [Bacteroidetes bacterium]|nr:enoyl-CoA hydratase/isomerase family protein [Bacteroidota bacterium]
SENLENDVKLFAQTIIKGVSGQALATTKTMIADIRTMTIEEALDYAAKINAEARSTDDCKKGISAFLNKEKLDW